MHHTALVLSLTLAAAPGAAESAPGLLPSDDAEELLAPVVIENLRADVDDSRLEISFTLQEVGAVSMTLRADDEGVGVGVVTVDDAVVTEVGFVDGAVSWETSNFAALGPARAVAVVAGLLQVWHDDAVTEALEDDRGIMCWYSGKLAGATLGVAVLAGCGLVAKDPTCFGIGYSVHSAVSGYIADKCNGAQNK